MTGSRNQTQDLSIISRPQCQQLTHDVITPRDANASRHLTWSIKLGFSRARRFQFHQWMLTKTKFASKVCLLSCLQNGFERHHRISFLLCFFHFKMSNSNFFGIVFLLGGIWTGDLPFPLLVHHATELRNVLTPKCYLSNTGGNHNEYLSGLLKPSFITILWWIIKFVIIIIM